MKSKKFKKQPAEVSLTTLLYAQKKFLEFSHRLDDEQLQTGAVKAFEYCYELSWKVMKRFVERDLNEEVKGSRDAFRGAARLGLIDNPEAWFEFNDERNHSAHVYYEGVMAAVIATLPCFAKELQKFIDKAKAHDSH